MKVIALGTGSAFCMKNWQTNFLIERYGHRILIDAGSDIRWSLKERGLSYLDIDGVYVSHTHADHIGGLEYLGFTSYFDPNWKSPRRLVPAHHVKMKLFCERGLIRLLWDHSLRGGMEGLEGIDANIDTYFEVTPVDKNKSFIWEGLQFDIVQSMHISAKYCIVDSFGLMFTDPDNRKRIYITTDVQFAPETSMKAYYREADLIVHDCETMYKSGVHAHYDQLATLPGEIKGKMLLTHYQDNVVDDFDSWHKKATDDGFRGFAQKGVIYDSKD